MKACAPAVVTLIGWWWWTHRLVCKMPIYFICDGIRTLNILISPPVLLTHVHSTKAFFTNIGKDNTEQRKHSESSKWVHESNHFLFIKSRCCQTSVDSESYSQFSYILEFYYHNKDEVFYGAFWSKRKGFWDDKSGKSHVILIAIAI
jgi:hypothetical protein